MQITKRVLAIVMLLVMTVSLCSCFGLSNVLKGLTSGSESRIKSETLAYMKEKYYGQEFVVDRVVIEEKHTIIYCYPKGSDSETDPVRVERTIIDGNAQYRDTYFNILIREDLEADVGSICKDLGLTVIVKFIGSSWLYMDNQFDGTKTYTDFKEWEKENKYLVTFKIYIYVDNQADCESIANEIIQRVQDEGLCASVRMPFYPIEYYTEKNIDNDMEGIDHKLIFKITE